MPQLSEFRQGDIGSIIRVTVQERNDTTGELEAVNVSGVATKQLIFRTPTGRKLTKTAAFTTDGTDGKLQFQTVAGFFDPKDKSLLGTWQVEAYLTGLGTWTGYTSIAQFRVLESLA